MSIYSQQQKKDEVYGAQTLYRELGYYIARKEQYDRALKAFDEAVKKSPNDKRALMGRSMARAKACRYEGALEDANQALEQDPGDLVVLAQRALNTYLGCEFEQALVANIRMIPQRKKPDNFTTGVMHCSEAIENCIGRRAGRPLRDHYKIIRKLAWKKAREADKPYQPKTKHKKKKKRSKTKKVEQKVVAVVPKKSSRTKTLKSGDALSTISRIATHEPVEDENAEAVSAHYSTAATTEVSDLSIRDSLHSHKSESDDIPPGKPFPYRPLQRYTSNIENYMAEKYLENMYLDKIFLKTLKDNVGAKSPNKAGSKKILQLAKEGYKTLSYKQELLRTRRPFYFIKYQEADLSGRLKDKQAIELKKLQVVTQKEVDYLMDKIKASIQEKNTRAALEASDKLRTFCETKSKRVLPKRDQYLEEMYNLVGEAFFSMWRLNKNQFMWDQEKRIYKAFGAPLEREPSNDSILHQFKDMFVDWKKQISVAEDRIRKASNPQELTWLYHELARSHTELKQYELARVYARKCITEARKIPNYSWIINAKLMIVRLNITQHNRNDAKLEINEALDIAKQMNNSTATEYLEKCMEIADKIDFEDVFGNKVLQKREKQIVDMMGESGMKDEVAFLFKKMSAMPAARRLSVMPGIKLEDSSDKPMSSRKMSIMPGARPPPEEETPRPLRMAKQKAETASEGGKVGGVGFMELIQFHVE